MKIILKTFIFTIIFGIVVCCRFCGDVVCCAKHEANNAGGIAVIEKTSKRLLYEYNCNEKLPMASTTKIITAINVIENCEDLDKVVTIPEVAQGVPGSSIYLRTGEHLTIRQLLYGLLLNSGNDSAVALAVLTSGSVDEFAILCNNFCEKIGAFNTHVVNPHGLHDDNHYTTAYDLALIAAYALENKVFAEIVSTQKTSIPQEFEKDVRYLKNTNKLLAKNSEITGVKTGYTKKAGRCLVSSAKRDEMEVVCVVLNCDKMFDISEKLLIDSLDNYHMVEILMPYTHIGSRMVEDGEKEVVNVYSSCGFCYPLKDDEKGLIRISYELPDVLSAPIDSQQDVGEISVFFGNELIFSDKIYTIEESRSTRFGDIVFRIIKSFA